MSDADVFATNRVLLTHFDSYSTALVFARFGNSLLAPTPLPDAATLLDIPPIVNSLANNGDDYAGERVTAATIEHFRFQPDQLYRDDRYDAWVRTGESLLRIHLLRARTFSAPADVVAALGGKFHPISELRTAARVELALVRGVFNLIMGGEQRHG